jgi:hypothetical protein
MSVIIDGSAGVTTNAGGSVNPSTNVEGINYSCRAWVNFNGTGTVAIRGSGNVTSITDNGTGDYYVNFSTSMPDTNYVITGSARIQDSTSADGAMFGTTRQNVATTYQTDKCRVNGLYPVNGDLYDAVVMSVAIFR